MGSEPRVRSPTGVPPDGGGERWSESADAVVRDTYPNYVVMRRRLPHRSLAALKHRAAALGVVRQRHIWMNVEVERLARLVLAAASNTELAAAFPDLRLRQITEKARHLRLPRRKLRLAKFGDPTLSAVRKRAIDVGMSLRCLDQAARTGRYFQKSTRRLVLAHVARAAAVLGGEILIEWEE